jgi:hypothetical protein
MAYPKKRDKEKSMEIDNWPEHEDPIKIAEVVDYHLRYNANLSDFVDETEKLSDQVNVILHDAEDDKLGRIRDIYNKEIKGIADWVEANHDVSSRAKWILDRATE